jgi:hypothetical protein
MPHHATLPETPVDLIKQEKSAYHADLPRPLTTGP